VARDYAAEYAARNFRARQSGFQSYGSQRRGERVAEARVSRGRGSPRVHAGTYVHDEAYNEDVHDLTEWVETPSSSRVSAFRYDHLNRAMQLTWRNNKNHGYIYLGVDFEGYRSFSRAASKGKNVNTNLNMYEYRLMTPEELQAPSNPERRGALTRQRT
jgi:hypothetical protein